MLSIFVPIVMLTASPADDFVSLFEKRISSMQTVQIELESKSHEWISAVTIKLSVKLPASQLFEVRSFQASYRLVQGNQRFVEFDLASKKYDRFPGPAKLITPNPEFSLIGWRSYPQFLQPNYLTSVLSMDGSKAKGAFDPPGQTEVMRYLQSPGENEKVQAWLDSTGTPKRFRLDYQTQRGPGFLDLLIKKWVWNPSLAGSLFNTTIPRGYSPGSLEANRSPLAISSLIPEGPWLEAFTNQLVKGRSLIEGGPLLVVVTSPSCPASARLAPFLNSLQAFMKQRNGRLIELSEKRGDQGPKNNGWPLYTDAQGTLDKALSVPGTPMFYLFDAQGKVAGLWYGDNPDKRDVLKSEIDFMIKNPPLDAME